MKLQDLRIGNWFVGFDNKPFIWSVDDFKLLESADISEIVKHPIKITEQLLVKCGFIEVENSTMSTTYEKSGFIYNKRVNTWYYWGVPINIKYLHELQNLYYNIIGEELRVKEL